MGGPPAESWGVPPNVSPDSMPLQRGRRRLWTRSYGHPCLWITPERRTACGQPEEHPTTRAEECLGRIRPGSPSGASHHPGGGRLRTDTPWARRRAPPELSAPLRRRALSTTCMGYRHQRALYPPHSVDNPLAVPTTRARAGRAFPTNRDLRRTPPRVTHTRTSIYETPDAHNGLISPLCAAPCFLIPSLVCGPEGDGRTTDAPRPPNPCRHRFRLCPRAQPLPRSRGAAVELRLPLVRRPVPCAPCA